MNPFRRHLVPAALVAALMMVISTAVSGTVPPPTSGFWGKVGTIGPKDDSYEWPDRSVTYALDRDVTFAEHQGRLYAIWSSMTDGDTLLMSHYDDEKGSWDRPIEVLPMDDVLDRHPTAVEYHGRLYVAWERGREVMDIYYTSYNATEGSWLAPAKVFSGHDGDRDYDETPRLAVYKDRLFLAWATMNLDIGIDTDFNIVLCEYDGSFACGKDRAHVPSLIDTPLNGPDVEPSLEVFDGLLWVAWATRDPVFSRGTDKDIVVRNFDGTGWSQVGEVTGPDVGVGNLTPDDGRPFMKASGDMLFVAWEGTLVEDLKDSDILIGHHKAGEPVTVWSAPGTVSRPGNRAWDGSPAIALLEGTLYVAWSTKDPEVKGGGDQDIVMRGFDGEKWGDISEVTHEPARAGHYLGDEDMVPAIIVHGQNGLDRIFLAWQVQYGEVLDNDILWRSYSHEPLGRGIERLAGGLFGIFLLGLLIMAPTILGGDGPGHGPKDKGNGKGRSKRPGQARGGRRH